MTLKNIDITFDFQTDCRKGQGPDPLLVSMPMPKDLDEYYMWINSQLDFVEKRGIRIKEYCAGIMETTL